MFNPDFNIAERPCSTVSHFSQDDNTKRKMRKCAYSDVLHPVAPQVSYENKYLTLLTHHPHPSPPRTPPHLVPCQVSPLPNPNFDVVNRSPSLALHQSTPPLLSHWSFPGFPGTVPLSPPVSNFKFRITRCNLFYINHCFRIKLSPQLLWLRLTIQLALIPFFLMCIRNSHCHHCTTLHDVNKVIFNYQTRVT